MVFFIPISNARVESASCAGVRLFRRRDDYGLVHENPMVFYAVFRLEDVGDVKFLLNVPSVRCPEVERYEQICSHVRDVAEGVEYAAHYRRPVVVAFLKMRIYGARAAEIFFPGGYVGLPGHGCNHCFG